MWQHFFKNPRKNYNPYMMKLKDYPKYIVYDKEVMNSYKGKWNEYFKNDKPIYLEIGSGNGNFAVRNSEKNSDINHMAIELRFKRLVISAQKAEKRSLENVVFFRRRGEEITDFVGESEITGMYINFPDPWEGKEKNRILQPKLFESIDKIMKNGGKLFFKTDHYGYYCDVLKFMDEVEGYEVAYHTDDLYSSPKIEDNISTEFEDLFVIKKGMKINYIEVEKKNQ